MRNQEEQYARELYRNLREAFSPNGSGFFNSLGLGLQPAQEVTVEVEGAGVHWHCTAATAIRSCQINCFAIDFTNFAYKGPEYYSEFTANGQTLATGRTFSQPETITAVSSWLQGQSLEDIYRQFAFVDVEKRKLWALLTEVTTSHPTLCTAEQCEIIEDYFLSSTLYFKNGNRGCIVDCVDYDHHMQYSFSWDGAVIFETTEADVLRIGALLEKWVIDATLPSALATEFPAIDFSPLASYYERGSGVEGEFMLSWDAIEAFYQRTEMEMQDDILILLQQMRARGFDKTLRAGQSLYTLILSRSRRHGLRAGQPALSFSFGSYGFYPSMAAMEVKFGDTTLTFDKTEYTDSLENLLLHLQQQLID